MSMIEVIFLGVNDAGMRVYGWICDREEVFVHSLLATKSQLDIVVDTEQQSVQAGVERVVDELRERGLLDERLDDEYGFSITRAEEQDTTERLEALGYLDE